MHHNNKTKNTSNQLTINNAISRSSPHQIKCLPSQPLRPGHPGQLRIHERIPACNGIVDRIKTLIYRSSGREPLLSSPPRTRRAEVSELPGEPGVCVRGGGRGGGEDTAFSPCKFIALVGEDASTWASSLSRKAKPARGALSFRDAGAAESRLLLAPTSILDVSGPRREDQVWELLRSVWVAAFFFRWVELGAVLWG